jgi:hypothetical protein
MAPVMKHMPTLSCMACSCTKLLRVAFHINQLTSIPSTIGQLKRVESVSWHRNQITDLPVEIGGMSCLRQLALFDNLLKRLPESIGKLKSVSELWIYGNQLEELPHTIGGMTSLRYCAPLVTCHASVALLSTVWLMGLPSTLSMKVTASSHVNISLSCWWRRQGPRACAMLRLHFT